ncbi:site-2 protease family protein [Mesorhizobium sp. MSK_1335]|uniref:Site-2 protease family protein n=1 Tax=Mesorhizobium montanum TaxID=3072323 RepID=A0ABU4ZF44_9HYPH|nr:site-2 protease family protein [Mesorhizobium sp. MSK_1335]MDX8523967.1 site-2 protease family protein [Mesorhizobium sp. MSK_1335]
MQRFGWDRKNDAFVFRMKGNIPVHVSWTFAVPAILPFLHEWSRHPRGALTRTVIFAVLLFLSVFLHELAHVRAARRRGIGTERIDLYLFGGIAWFKPGMASPYGWAWIAFAGPLANIVLAAGFTASYYLVARPLLPVEPDGFFNLPPPRPDTLLEWTLWLGALLNTVLAILNLLPAYPLDGGTIARHLLAPRFGADTAARIVGFCGVVLSILRFAVILAAAIAGTMLWIPPSFRPNWRAFRATGNKRPVHPA